MKTHIALQGSRNCFKKNQQGQHILDAILNHPEREIIYHPSGMFEVCIPKSQRARFFPDGRFKGFLER